MSAQRMATAGAISADQAELMPADQAALMDDTYRRQRHIYDATRKFFLLGRDRMIDGLNPPAGARVLEIACGTGRNLALIGMLYPETRRFGLDISAEMLRSARRTLGDDAVLAEADACSFDAGRLLGEPVFERIALSYSLSMIPDWPAALREARAHLAPGGSLHIVDFGMQDGLPGWFRRSLHGWLGRFHVAPRPDLPAVAEALAAETGATLSRQSLYRGYAEMLVLRDRRPA